MNKRENAIGFYHRGAEHTEAEGRRTLPKLNADRRRSEPESLRPVRCIHLCGWIFIAAAFAAALAGCGGARRSAPAPGYVGNRNSGIVHRADCSNAAKIAPTHRVPFDKLDDALAEGFRPCRHCLRQAVPSTATRP
jgi:hypothetical protein